MLSMFPDDPLSLSFNSCGLLRALLKCRRHAQLITYIPDRKAFLEVIVWYI
jgi:hypothetical protein